MKKKTIKGSLSLNKKSISLLDGKFITGRGLSNTPDGESICLCGPRESIDGCYSYNNMSCNLPCTGF